MPTDAQGRTPGACLCGGKLWLALICIIALGALGTAVYFASRHNTLGMAGASPIQSVKRDEGRFYRFRARFSVKATGEELAFDVVVPCQRILTTYKWGETTVDMAAQPRTAPYPFLFPKVTRGNQALLVAVPNACSDFKTENGRVRIPSPPDMMPKATWFENADRLDFGLMYAHPAAYDSPLAQIRFHEASIEPAAASDYSAWLGGLSRDFRPTKNIIFPYGFADGQIRIGGSWPLAQRDDGWLWVALECYGIKRYRITDEVVRARLRELWPTDRPRYWDPRATLGEDGFQKFELSIAALPRAREVPAFEGRRQGEWLLPERNLTVAPRDGGPVFHGGGHVYPAPVFPLTRGDMFDPWFTLDRDDTRRSYIDYETRNGALFGFLGCTNGSGAHPSQPERMRKNYAFFNDAIARLDGTELPRKPGGGPPLSFYENDEFYWMPVRISITGDA